MRRAALRARARKPAARRAVTTPATPTAPTAMAAKQAERRAWGAAQKGGPAKLAKLEWTEVFTGFAKNSLFEVTWGPVQTRYTHGQDQQGRHTGPLCQPRNRFVMFIRTRMSMWHMSVVACVSAPRALQPVPYSPQIAARSPQTPTRHYHRLCARPCARSTPLRPCRRLGLAPLEQRVRPAPRPARLCALCSRSLLDRPQPNPQPTLSKP